MFGIIWKRKPERNNLSGLYNLISIRLGNQHCEQQRRLQYNYDNRQ